MGLSSFEVEHSLYHIVYDLSVLELITNHSIWSRYGWKWIQIIDSNMLIMSFSINSLLNCNKIFNFLEPMAMWNCIRDQVLMSLLERTAQVSSLFIFFFYGMRLLRYQSTSKLFRKEYNSLRYMFGSWRTSENLRPFREDVWLYQIWVWKKLRDCLRVSFFAHTPLSHMALNVKLFTANTIIRQVNAWHSPSKVIYQVNAYCFQWNMNDLEILGLP